MKLINDLTYSLESTSGEIWLAEISLPLMKVDFQMGWMDKREMLQMYRERRKKETDIGFLR